MLAIAVVGLAINAISLLVLRGSASESLNVKGAYFEVLSDFITSIGVIVGAVVMWVTRWFYVVRSSLRRLGCSSLCCS